MAEYRILICGDRNWSDYDMILGFVSSLPKNSIIINGMAKGADKMAGKAGEANGLEVLKFPADWSGPKKRPLVFLETYR